MSAPHNNETHAHPAHDVAHEAAHEGPIRTTKQLIWAVVASFIIPIVGIILLVNYVNFDKKSAAGSSGFTPEAVAQRLQRVGSVVVRDLSDPSALRTGEQVTQAQCAACHAAGAAGAPKLGDNAAWAARLATGYDALLNSALKGKGSMGAQGGGDYTDFEIGRAVVYMANQAGGKFAEPQAPAPAASAPN
jgi:cytochrome c5